MIVTCENCAARYKLDDAKISGRGAKITCPRCRHVFVVFRSAAAADETPSSVARVKAAPPASPRDSAFEVSLPSRSPSMVPAPAASAPDSPPPPPRERALTSGGLDVHSLDFRKVGIQSWKVKVKIGLIYDFSDYKTLRKYIQDGRVTPADLLSHDGRNWTPIGDIPDLERHFVEVYEENDKRRAEASRKEAELPPMSGFEEETPTMIVGMSEVVDSLAARLAANEDPVPDDVDPARPPTGAPRRSGGLSAPASVSPPAASSATGPVFTDPFEDMKQRQRGRIAARRAQKVSAEPAAPSSGASPLWLFLLGLVAVGIGGWIYLNRDAVAPVAPATPDPLTPAAEAAPGPEDIREKLRAELEAELKTVESEPEPIRVETPPEQLIPVRPTDAQLRSSPGSSSSSTPPSTASGPSAEQFSASPITARDHADAGDDAWRRAAWREAAAAYGQAVSLEPSNATYALKLGRARYKAGDSSGARQVLTKASQGGQIEASKWLGHIARDQGDTAGAIGHYNTYLKSTPSDAGEIQSEIDALTGS